MEILDNSAERVIVIGPSLHFVSQNHAAFWPRISEWLGSNPKRSLQILIQERAGRDLHRETPKQLAVSKRVFRNWLENAISFDPPLKLGIFTLRPMIRSGVTVVNPDSNDAFTVVVPLIFQALLGDRLTS